MKKNKKIVLITLVVVAVLVITLGVVAVTQANDQGTGQSANVSLFDKVAAIYKTNTGNAIDSAALQKAFQQAQQQLATDAQNAMMKKLVDSGKITQKQADDYQAWLAAKPALNTDALKKWMDSKPAGIPFGPGMGFPGGAGKMFHR
jgi:competence protein ComGC